MEIDKTVKSVNFSSILKVDHVISSNMFCLLSCFELSKMPCSLMMMMMMMMMMMVHMFADLYIYSTFVCIFIDIDISKRPLKVRYFLQASDLLFWVQSISTVHMVRAY